jgi:hypothetical protein
MGIAVNLIPTLMDCIRFHGLSGSLLMLGRQDVEVDQDRLSKIFAAEGMEPRIAPQYSPTDNDRLTPETFFAMLGFSSAESLDITAKEGASILFDLNSPATPADLRSRFDVIFDGGTLEHVFHIPNALARGTEMLRDGGAFCHIGPMNNYTDHGFYQFSPTLWFDWFFANNWLVSESVMVRLPSFNRAEPSGWTFSTLSVGELGRVGQLDDAPRMHFLVARRGAAARGDQIPVQNYYASKGQTGSLERLKMRRVAPYVVTNGIRSDLNTEDAGLSVVRRDRL